MNCRVTRSQFVVFALGHAALLAGHMGNKMTQNCVPCYSDYRLEMSSLCLCSYDSVNVIQMVHMSRTAPLQPKSLIFEPLRVILDIVCPVTLLF